MNAERWSQIKTIFDAACELPPEERGEYLHEACAGDGDLRADVEKLLAGDQSEGNDSFLEPPSTRMSYGAIAGAPADPAATSDESGIVLGQYRLEKRLASGGMGTVYLASRLESYEERVAIKLIKRGMDTELILKRFQNERQTLARLAHPHIGRLLDGGATEDGRPYLVMEYIDGLPIDQYCDERELSITSRLQLFLDVCAAVHFAHTQHVIHRDLKPSNILVIEQADRPIAKIIDFGIATLMAESGDGNTTLTVHGQVLGSPRYMSPEQASIDAAQVDERADVYSLGVVLYVLLVGSLPYEKVPDTVDELRRLHDVDAPTPSTRVRIASDDTTGIARRRGMDPDRLRRVLHGDLDWITRRALEVQRDRRYPTASAMAAEIERFLRNEPVLAGPPGARYRLARFARRNKLFVVVLFALFVSILAGLVASTGWYVRADRLRGDRNALLRITDSVASEVSEAHLWFEEWLADDASVKIDADVFDRLTDSRARVDSIIHGPSDRDPEIGAFVRNQNLSAVESLAIQLEDFDVLTRERWRKGKDGGQTGGALDQRYDAIYFAIQSTCTQIREAVDNADFRDWRRSASMSIRIHALVLVTFAALILLLLRKRTV